MSFFYQIFFHCRSPSSPLYLCLSIFLFVFNPLTCLSGLCGGESNRALQRLSQSMFQMHCMFKSAPARKIQWTRWCDLLQILLRFFVLHFWVRFFLVLIYSPLFRVFLLPPPPSIIRGNTLLFVWENRTWWFTLDMDMVDRPALTGNFFGICTS